MTGQKSCGLRCSATGTIAIFREKSRGGNTLRAREHANSEKTRTHSGKQADRERKKIPINRLITENQGRKTHGWLPIS